METNEPAVQPLVGGRYLVKDGVRTLVEEPTKDHVEGNRARDDKGAPIAAPTEAEANAERAATPAAAPGRINRSPRGKAEGER